MRARRGERPVSFESVVKAMKRMANYEVFNKPSARKELESVGTKHDRQKIFAAIQGLATEPRSTGSQKFVTRNVRDSDNLLGVAVLGC